jgi:hypothetical protein
MAALIVNAHYERVLGSPAPSILRDSVILVAADEAQLN